MQKNPDGSVVFTQLEMKSLRKLVKACSDAISSLASDGDFLGWDNYRALGMWEDKLKGEKHELSYYVEDEEDENAPKSKKQSTTVDEWLDAYGKRRA